MVVMEEELSEDRVECGSESESLIPIFMRIYSSGPLVLDTAGRVRLA
jgi:hypothetical protein